MTSIHALPIHRHTSINGLKSTSRQRTIRPLTSKAITCSSYIEKGYKEEDTTKDLMIFHKKKASLGYGIGRFRDLESG